MIGRQCIFKGQIFSDSRALNQTWRDILKWIFQQWFYVLSNLCCFNLKNEFLKRSNMSSKIDIRGRETDWQKRFKCSLKRGQEGPKTNAGKVSVKYFDDFSFVTAINFLMKNILNKFTSCRGQDLEFQTS